MAAVRSYKGWEIECNEAAGQWTATKNGRILTSGSWHDLLGQINAEEGELPDPRKVKPWKG